MPGGSAVRLILKAQGKVSGSLRLWDWYAVLEDGFEDVSRWVPTRHYATRMGKASATRTVHHSLRRTFFDTDRWELIALEVGA